MTTNGAQALAPSSARPKSHGETARRAPRDDVDQVAHGHRRDLPDPELVVGEQAVDDQTDAEHDRDGGPSPFRPPASHNSSRFWLT
jgi:hypothetical protein